MKYTGQGRKTYLVIQWDAEQSEWRVISKPVTFKSGIWLLLDKPNLKRDIVSISLWNNGYRPGVSLPSVKAA